MGNPVRRFEPDQPTHHTSNISARNAAKSSESASAFCALVDSDDGRDNRKHTSGAKQGQARETIDLYTRWGSGI